MTVVTVTVVTVTVVIVIVVIATVVIVIEVIVIVVIVIVVIVTIFSKNNFNIFTIEEIFEGQRFAILAMFNILFQLKQPRNMVGPNLPWILDSMLSQA